MRFAKPRGLKVNQDLENRATETGSSCDHGAGGVGPATSEQAGDADAHASRPVGGLGVFQIPGKGTAEVV